MPGESSLAGALMKLVHQTPISWVWGAAEQAQESDLAELCRALLSSRGQASGIAIADRVLTLFEGLEEQEQIAFFTLLETDFEVDLVAVREAVALAQSNGAEGFAALQKAAEPSRQELLRRLNAAPQGTSRLVALRAKLLKLLRDHPHLATIDNDLRHLLTSWFNRGFLLPTRIDWSTSAEVLEKIIAYEAVHAIDNWEALRLRLVPPDRRCFAFFHPAMPNEPLIFVEVALMDGIASSIQNVLDEDRAPIDARHANTAVFYSISNCQAGLAGISFGAFLIKQVAADLAHELPNLTKFATLSPLPGFAIWLASEVENSDAKPLEGEALRSLATTYLIDAKDRRGRPLDAVAKFHLGNGAQLHQIQCDADMSAKGMAQSHGLMVNYLYELDKVESRHEAYATAGELSISRAVKSLHQKTGESDWARSLFQTDKT
ncbi:MAG: malonyl-CoA decarboxylase [Hyphomicrobiales bacterium]